MTSSFRHAPYHLSLSMKTSFLTLRVATVFWQRRGLVAGHSLFRKLENFCSRCSDSVPSSSTCLASVRRISGVVRGQTSKMAIRLVQFQTAAGNQPRVGVELENGGNVVDVTNIDAAIPSDMRSFLDSWETSLPATLRAVEQAKSQGQGIISPSEFTLKAPIYNPEKLICIGLNYIDHCTEQNVPVPVEPVIFSKFSSAITEPNGPVILPSLTTQLDYEVELAFVISKQGKDIPESQAMSHVAGYTIAHDVSARDWQLQKNGKQWLLGKTFDTFCPLGPALVTTASLSDPHNLGIRCRLNGEVVQNSNTNQLVHKTEGLIAFISQFVTLNPGDVVLTGTPPGVGCFRKPPLWLKKGDVVECEVDEIGKITNVIQ